MVEKTKFISGYKDLKNLGPGIARVYFGAELHDVNSIRNNIDRSTIDMNFIFLISIFY